MNTLIVAVAARWEECLRELLSRRGHNFSVVNDLREINSALRQTDCALCFVGINDDLDECTEICRRLRDGSWAWSAEILICGNISERDGIESLLSAGADDCLTDPENRSELEFRLTMAEIRHSRRSGAEVIHGPGAGRSKKDVSDPGESVGYFRSSLEGKFIDVDQTLVDLLGYKSREELMQIDIARDLYLDPSIRTRFLSGITAEYQTQEFISKRRDGRPIAVRLTWRRVFDQSGNFLYFEGTSKDVSKSMEDPEFIRILYDLALKLYNTSDLRRTLDEILYTAMQIGGADCGCIYLFNGATNNFELAASLGFSPGFKRALSQYSLTDPQMQYIMQGRLLHISLAEVPLPKRAFFEKEGVKCGIIAPIAHQGHIIATLNLASRTHNTILPRHRRAFEAMTLHVGGLVVRAQAEAAREISRQNLQSLFDTLQDMIIVLDRTGKILYANRMVGRCLGYSPAELSSMKITDLHPPQRHQELLDLFAKLVAGEAVVCNIPFLTKDGLQIPVEILGTLGKWGEIEAVFGIARDMSERQRARLMLHESQSRFRALFESAAVGMILADMQGRMLAVNGAFAKMLGYTPGELIGKHYTALTNPEDIGVQNALLRELFEGKRDSFLLEKRYIHKNGGVIWGRINISGIRDTEDKLIYGVGVVEDITEKKLAAQTIQNEQQLLRRIIDLHERDRQITAYEIHDGIAQQVTAALLHLEAFRRLSESDAENAEKSLETALKLIGESVDESRRLISGLRPLILDEYGVVEAIDYLVCENRERSGTRIDFSHDVRFKRLAPPLESAAFRIVQEALSNACRHSLSPIVFVKLEQRGDQLHIEVRDQGVGFDPNAVGETRFGLRSIRERARLLGGKAEIISAPGSGTSIAADLPVVLRAEEHD
jgi:PAS domain S-box-containing protein